MYCKYCGRQLKEGARFCDRCGQSVRKTQESGKAQKQREIEELKAERLNRKQRLADKEEKQQRAKGRKKRGGGVIIFMLVIVLIAIASVIIGYNIFPSGSKTTNLSTSESTEKSSSSASSSSNSVSTDQGAYSEITVGNITCPYPSSFYINTATGNEKLNVTDSLGGANMIVAQEAKTGDIKDLLKDYITEIGATDDPEMHGNTDWYAVTATVGGTVYHRKCILRNSLAVYYDFTYDASSESAKKYEEYIRYIDSKFN